MLNRSRSSSRQAAGIAWRRVNLRCRLDRCYLVWGSHAVVVILLTLRQGPLGQMDASDQRTPAV